MEQMERKLRVYHHHYSWFHRRVVEIESLDRWQKCSWISP